MLGRGQVLRLGLRGGPVLHSNHVRRRGGELTGVDLLDIDAWPESA